MAQDNHREYSASDFERYHSGQMPAAEMHALEKAALEDPFLADALEGYAYTSTPAADIAELKSRLAPKKKKGAVFFLQSRTLGRIAASVILIAGIGYLVYLFNVSPKKADLQTAPQATAKVAPDSIMIAKNDTPKQRTAPPTSADLAIADETTKGRVELKVPLRQVQQADSNMFAINEDKAATNAIAEDEMLLKKQKNESRDTEAREKNASAYYKQELKPATNIIQGTVKDDKGSPVAFATVKDVKRNITTSTDTLGRFKLSTPDSVLTARIAAIGYESKERQLAKNDKQQEIVLQQNNNTLSEVVVTAAGVKVRGKSLGYAVKKIAPADIQKDSTIGPIGGWTKFRQYLFDNIHSQSNPNGQAYKGNVTLTFEANRSGHLKKIKVIKSLCPACDKEAIRLLQSGPRWKFSHGKVYEVRVEF